MVRKIDRTGEERVNNFGSKMIITRYNTVKDIDIYFPEYNWTYKHGNYNNFKNGKVQCPYEPRTFGVGYIGEGEYMTSVKSILNKEYNHWYNMIKRCYSKEFQNDNSSYMGCKMEEYLLNFQNFSEWIKSIYYEVPNEVMEIDKDILIKGNKIYSRDTCLLVPQRINNLFIKKQTSRGNLPIGVSENKLRNKYMARMKMSNKPNDYISLGAYDTPVEAFIVYKRYKEEYIKQVADEYKQYIPKKIYDAMYKYEIEITD